MARNSPEFSFVSRWRLMLGKGFGKNSTQNLLVPFSESLLYTLYNETDIGSIPRGIKTSDLPLPLYRTSSNWRKGIIGCYWCCFERTDIQGICCSNGCLLCFYEWCVETVGKKNYKRFCKYPGCGVSPSEIRHSFCSHNHKEQYFEEYSSYIGVDQLRREIVKGPCWYDNTIQYDSRSGIVYPDFSRAKRRLAEDLSTALFFYTDVGPIPRSFREGDTSSSQYSTHKNWKKEIEGCYQCGKDTTGNEYLCSGRCYVVFHEWCRLKVSENTSSMNFCQQLGCGQKVTSRYSTCSRDHSKDILNSFEKYDITLSELNELVTKGPHWYENTVHTNATSTPTSNPHKTKSPNTNVKPVPTSNSQKVESPRDFYVFSQSLTEWMYKESDIGPIPRSLIKRFPSLHSMNTQKSPSNWDANIPLCYWCCEGNLTIHGIACSDKCFFLFNEWCHKKYQQSTKMKLCKHPSCKTIMYISRDCCFTHSDTYRQKYSSKHSPLLRSTEYSLGPKWYSDKSIRSIDFYNKEDPFYEFTNFYPCKRLKIDGSDWSTTEHYFQSQKFVGTPLVEVIRGLKTPREAFDYTRHSKITKWVRPDWQKVKEGVMLKALEEKFDQNGDLAEILNRTGSAQLYEHTWNDNYWGDGGDRKGRNALGQLLTQVRFDLHKKSPFLPSRLEHIKPEVPDSIPTNPPASNHVNPVDSKPSELSPVHDRSTDFESNKKKFENMSSPHGSLAIGKNKFSFQNKGTAETLDIRSNKPDPPNPNHDNSPLKSTPVDQNDNHPLKPLTDGPSNSTKYHGSADAASKSRQDSAMKERTDSSINLNNKSASTPDSGGCIPIENTGNIPGGTSPTSVRYPNLDKEMDNKQGFHMHLKNPIKTTLSNDCENNSRDGESNNTTTSPSQLDPKKGPTSPTTQKALHQYDAKQVGKSSQLQHKTDISQSSSTGAKPDASDRPGEKVIPKPDHLSTKMIQCLDTRK